MILEGLNQDIKTGSGSISGSDIFPETNADPTKKMNMVLTLTHATRTVPFHRAVASLPYK